MPRATLQIDHHELATLTSSGRVKASVLPLVLRAQRRLIGALGNRVSIRRAMSASVDAAYTARVPPVRRSGNYLPEQLRRRNLRRARACSAAANRRMTILKISQACRAAARTRRFVRRTQTMQSERIRRPPGAFVWARRQRFAAPPRAGECSGCAARHGELVIRYGSSADHVDRAAESITALIMLQRAASR